MQMQTLETILSEHTFLRGLDQKYIQLMAGCASNQVFQPGEFLMKEGTDANHFFIIRHGRVSIEIDAPGQGAIPIQTVSEGEILGWSWLFPPYKSYADGRAVELTRVISLDGECLRGKCEDDHDLGYELMKRFAQVMAERLGAARLQLLDIYGKSSN